MKCPDCESDNCVEIVELDFDGCIYKHVVLYQCRDCKTVYRELF